MSLATPERPPTEAAGAPPAPLTPTPKAPLGEEPLAKVEATPSAVVSPGLVAIAAALAIGATSMMMAGVFQGLPARAAAMAAAAVGVGLSYVAARTGRALVQYLGLPVGAILGALLVVPEANGQGSANLPGLVVEAVRSGGFLQPPVPFDPGWRFIIVVLCCLLGAAVTAIALGRRKPKLAVLLTIPLAMGAELVQPPADELWATLVAIGMYLAALAVANGAELRTEGVQVTRAFELRRLGRSAAMGLVLVGIVFGLSRAGFLFPQPDRHTITPPEKPQLPPPQPDRPLFSMKADRKAPLRLGVIDQYDQKQNAWLLPPYDTARFRVVQNGGVPNPRAGAQKTSAQVTVMEAEGHILPTVAGLTRIEGIRDKVDFDPRTQTLRLTDRRVYHGLRYTMSIPAIPTGYELSKVGSPPASYRDFLDAPSPPTKVLELLSGAPQDSFDRLQTLRNALYSSVVAAGIGKPVDLPPSRVVDMLNGKEATPYEITAAEALLARWAGVPSRIGYGYYGGTAHPDGSLEYHPRDGATWMEAYFDGYGWVPIVGTPLKAKSSNSPQEKNPNPAIKPSDNISVVLYVPVRVSTALLYFQIAQYFLALVAPYVLAAVVLLIVYPGVLKIARRIKRRRWARPLGPAARVTVAYAELRDICNDLTFGDPLATPIEFLQAINEDDEHRELAWLVTRALWGDMTRDLRDSDAREAEVLAASITRRLIRAQNVLNLALAFVARTSLRDPYTRAIPNPWPVPQPGSPQTRAGRRRKRRFALPGLRRIPMARQLLPKSLLGILGMLLLVACGDLPDYVGPTSFAPHLVPPSIGAIILERQPKLESQYLHAGPDSLVQSGEVYLIKHDDVVEGTVQLSLLKKDVRVEDDLVYSGADRGIGGRQFARVRVIPEQRTWIKELADQRIYMWYPPRANVVELIVLRKQFGQHLELVQDLEDYQHGRAPKPFTIPPPPPPAPTLPTDELGNPTTIQPLPGVNGVLQPSPTAPSR